MYKDTLTEFEQISLTQVRRVLGNYPIVFVAPEGKMFPYFFAGSRAVHFPRQFFQSVDTYNALMLSPLFYNAFREYEYILVYQLDAFVFSDKLEYFCGLGYDYIGAPWPRMWGEGVIVGNGGFSLRKVNTHYRILNICSAWVQKSLTAGISEDTFLSYLGTLPESNFEVAPVNIANKFAVEFHPARCVKKNGGELPFGCHSWKDKSAAFYIKTFLSYGYDLRHLANRLDNIDFTHLRNWLTILAFTRLNRRLKNELPIGIYLARQNYASIRVLRNSDSTLILTRILAENINVSDAIYFCDEDKLDSLIHELKSDNRAHLLICSDFDVDNDVMAKARVHNLNLDSFIQNYLCCCENMFHNLGK